MRVMKKFTAGLLLVVLLLTLCSCAPEKSIVGTWKYQTTVLGVVTETVYTFNEDGTGTRSGVVTTDFTYSFSDDTLLITTNLLGIEMTEEYTYDFGIDHLVLTDENNTIELDKVN